MRQLVVAGPEDYHRDIAAHPHAAVRIVRGAAHRWRDTPHRLNRFGRVTDQRMPHGRLDGGHHVSHVDLKTEVRCGGLQLSCHIPDLTDDGVVILAGHGAEVNRRLTVVWHDVRLDPT